MLGKLIKYDLKAVNRYLIVIHAFLILASVFMRIFLTGRLFAEGIDFDNQKTAVYFILFFTAFVLLIGAIAFATQLIIAMRFYKNLFSAEGYLTHTLPVTTGEHLLSKTISGCIWGIINVIFFHISILIVAATPYTIDLFVKNSFKIQSELGFTDESSSLSITGFLLLYLAVCLISVVTNIVLFYASIAIGQLIYSHKILGAVAAYFVISTVFSFVALILMAFSGLLGASMHPSDSFNFINYMGGSLKLNGIFAVIQIALLYPATYYIMKKKINLD